MSATQWYRSGYDSYPALPYNLQGTRPGDATPSQHTGSSRRGPPAPLNIKAARAYLNAPPPDYRVPTGQNSNQQPDLIDGIDYFKASHHL